jgi:hypothetical protein
MSLCRHVTAKHLKSSVNRIFLCNQVKLRALKITTPMDVCKNKLSNLVTNLSPYYDSYLFQTTISR